MEYVNELTEAYARQYPAEVARTIAEQPELFSEAKSLSTATINLLFDRIDPSTLRGLFYQLSDEQQVDILQNASVRLGLVILRSLTDEEQAQVLARMNTLAREEFSKLLSFSESSAGYYMDRPTANFFVHDPVEQCLNKLRASNLKSIRSIYVVDADNYLAGRVDMQDMATATRDTLLRDLIIPVEGVVTLTSPRQELLDIFKRSPVDSVPLVDTDSRLVGVVRYASLFRAAEMDTSASLQRMVGASAEEKALSSPWFAVKKRLPWLHINLVTAFLAASVVALFEATIAQFTALAILLPVVAGQSGNAGSQALAVTMRGLALKEVSILHWRGVLSKEIQIGVIDGMALAVTCGLGVLVWSGSLGLGLVIAIAMIVSMIAAGISGALVPMMLIRIGQDPATASSIILTTVTDVAGFFSFLGTATLLSFML